MSKDSLMELSVDRACEVDQAHMATYTSLMQLSKTHGDGPSAQKDERRHAVASRRQRTANWG